MAEVQSANAYEDDDHQSAYIFNPLEEEEQTARPSKRRKVSKKIEAATPAIGDSFEYTALFNGREDAAAARSRQRLYEASWSSISSRVQNILRKANQSTLDEVGSFVREAPAATDKIPTAFIVTGPNIASQKLLFEQLSEELSDICRGRFVRIQSAEAPNLKSTLKKIIRDVTARAVEDDDDLEVAVGHDGRKYLDYDLEALFTFVRPHASRRVVLAFEDGEAFDGGLISDLIALLKAWQDRIQFTLLFGIATSVDLFQARLLKSACQHLYGGQFDVVQSTAILDSVVKCAVASADIDVRIGPSLLRSLVERHNEQVAGIDPFINSLKYAHMCHFYANPLSVFLSDTGDWQFTLAQPEHLESIRVLPSFKARVEGLVEGQIARQAKLLLENDDYLTKEAAKELSTRRKWVIQLLRSVQLILTSRLSKKSFTELYISAVAEGVDGHNEAFDYVNTIRNMTADDILTLVDLLLQTIRKGDPDLALMPWDEEASDLIHSLTMARSSIEKLKTQAQDKGQSLRSKYTAQSKVLRTTVVAQKVQLSQDSSALSDEDKAFTKCVDDLVRVVSEAITCEPAESLFLHEAWLYDSRSPYKDVFVPRPAAILARALSQPHDYLACSCCSGTRGGNVSTLPPTAILYKLYLETGALVNVADLWSAFYGVVGGEDESGCDERTALVLFYRALAELKAMGFVKASRKKADHIAKVKWL